MGTPRRCAPLSRWWRRDSVIATGGQDHDEERKGKFFHFNLPSLREGLDKKTTIGKGSVWKLPSVGTDWTKRKSQGLDREVSGWTKREMDQQEFLYKLFCHVVLGGKLNQYEDDVDEYRQATKALYRALIRCEFCIKGEVEALTTSE